MTQVFAFEESIEMIDDSDPNRIYDPTIGIVLTLLRLGGVILCICGVYNIVSSLKDKRRDKESKSGMIMALAGVVMIATKSVIRPDGLNLISLIW